MALNGALAGLVAITASCAWVEAWAAVVIGSVAGVLVVVGVLLLENNPVGAVSVHGIDGIWGLLAVGIFADGTHGIYTAQAPQIIGLLYGGGFEQLLAQVIGAPAAVIWAFILGFALFKVVDILFGIRVSPEVELSGLDIDEHGSSAYPNFINVEEIIS